MGSVSALPSSEVAELEVKKLIIEALKLEDITVDDIDSTSELIGAGLGLDSIDILELAMAIHGKFGVRVQADDASNREIFGSVRSLAEFILEKQEEGSIKQTGAKQ